MAALTRFPLARFIIAGPKRQFSTTLARNTQEWQQRGVTGSNLPFSIHNRYKATLIMTVLLYVYFQNLPFSIQNRYKVTLIMTVFFASGFNAPFLVVRQQLLKK